MACDLAREALAPEGVLPLRVNEMTPSVIICAEGSRISIQWREQRPDQPDHDEYGRAEAMAAFLVEAANRHGTAYDAIGSGVKALQARVGAWTLECFGDEITCDLLERMDRFTEEALELVQSLGYTPDRAHALVDYVFGREAGEPSQEVGGSMTTLAALCNVARIDIEAAFRTEVDRITTPEMVEKIRAKQAAKPTGSALPVALSTHTAAGAGPVCEAVDDLQDEQAAVRFYRDNPRTALFDLNRRLAARPVEEPGEVEPVLHRGSFSCLGSVAVEAAHVLSWARLSADAEGGTALETGEILADYSRGNINADDAIFALAEGVKDAALTGDAQEAGE